MPTGTITEKVKKNGLLGIFFCQRKKMHNSSRKSSTLFSNNSQCLCNAYYTEISIYCCLPVSMEDWLGSRTPMDTKICRCSTPLQKTIFKTALTRHSQARRCSSATPALRKREQGDPELKATLGYTGRPRLRETQDWSCRSVVLSSTKVLG